MLFYVILVFFFSHIFLLSPVWPFPPCLVSGHPPGDPADRRSDPRVSGALPVHEASSEAGWCCTEEVYWWGGSPAQDWQQWHWRHGASVHETSCSRESDGQAPRELFTYLFSNLFYLYLSIFPFQTWFFTLCSCTNVIFLSNEFCNFLFKSLLCIYKSSEWFCLLLTVDLL